MSDAKTEATLLGSALTTVIDGIASASVLLRDFPRLAELQDLDPEARYPLSLYVETTDYIESLFGYGSMLLLGKKVGEMVVDVSLAQLDIEDPIGAIHAVQGAHEFFCQPPVGAFRIDSVADGWVHIHYTAPYNCVLQEGLLQAIAARYGSVAPIVLHPVCRRRGADHCEFRMML